MLLSSSYIIIITIIIIITTITLEEVDNKQYPDGHFSGSIKDGQRYNGTLKYAANDEKKRIEYTGSFQNGE